MDEKILHQDDVEEVIHDVLEEEDVVIGGDPEAAIEDASEAHALNASWDDDEAEAAMDALGATINEILAALRAKNIIATE